MAPPTMENMISSEEKKIIVEVRRKNLLFKSIPLSLGAMFGSKQLVTRGIVGQKWLFPMYVGSTIVGLYVGIKSTPEDIKSRVMREVPDGVLSQIFRETEKMTPAQKMDYLSNLDQIKLRGVPSNPPLQTQHGTTTGGHQGNTDLFTQPSQDRLSPKPETVQGAPSPQPGFSYSKQRMLNDQPYGGGASTPPSATSFGEDKSAMQHSNIKKGRRNQYGDEME